MGSEFKINQIIMEYTKLILDIAFILIGMSTLWRYFRYKLYKVEQPILGKLLILTILPLIIVWSFLSILTFLN